MEALKDIINIDTEILSGQPVFTGTRVPIESLFMHLEKGISLDEFLFDFPSVSMEHAIAVLEIAGKIVSSKNIEHIYETTT
jgi:uncharacterized protein (DUF433 family)